MRTEEYGHDMRPCQSDPGFKGQAVLSSFHIRVRRDIAARTSVCQLVVSGVHTIDRLRRWNVQRMLPYGAGINYYALN